MFAEFITYVWIVGRMQATGCGANTSASSNIFNCECLRIRMYVWKCVCVCECLGNLCLLYQNIHFLKYSLRFQPKTKAKLAPGGAIESCTYKCLWIWHQDVLKGFNQETKQHSYQPNPGLHFIYMARPTDWRTAGQINIYASADTHFELNFAFYHLDQ